MLFFGSCSTEGPNMCIRDYIKSLMITTSHPYRKQPGDPSAFNQCLSQNGKQQFPRFDVSSAMSLMGMKRYLRANFAFLRHTV